MEEVKKEDSSETCAHQCMNIHQFCGKQVCVIRVFFIAIVIFAVFAAGFASGLCAAAERQDRNYRGFGSGDNALYGYGPGMMMRDYRSDDSRWEGQSVYPTTRSNVTYRMMGQPIQIERIETGTGTPR